MNKKGITMMEIVVAAVIFALVLVTLANLFIGGKKYIVHSRSRMAGGELGKFFLDPLQQQVRQDQWSDNCLGSLDPAKCQEQYRTVNNLEYKAQYNVADVNESDTRHVTTTITWTEPKP